MPASARPGVRSVYPLILCLGLTLAPSLPAEETENGADVAALLRKAQAGDVTAQLEVTEHFLINSTADLDGDPARDFKQIERWLQAAALQGSAPAARMLGELLLCDYPGIPVDPARAFAAFQKAALGGDLRAMLEMGHLHSNGTGTPQDFAKAEEWMNKAFAKAPEGSPERDQAAMMLTRLADRREAAGEQEELAKETESTDPAVRFELGRRLLAEAGSDHDQQSAAVAHLRFAAEAGHAEAQDAYGMQLERQDSATGFAWRLKAAEAGLASAQSHAALVLLRGRGPIPADPAKGLDLAVRAQLQGDQMLTKALNGTGYFPGLSSSEAQNLAYSAAPADRTRLLAAAARGEPEAQRWLARGPKPEAGAIVRWLVLAAKQEHPGAQFSLGMAYFNGNEVSRDRAQAAAWRSRAALLGHPEAQMTLAQDLLDGSGVPANPALARYWFEFVAASPAFIEGHRKIARDKAAAIAVAALPPAAALEQTKILALTARLPGVTAPTATDQTAESLARPPEERRAAAEKGDAESMYQLGLADLERRRIWSDKLNGVIPVDRLRDETDFRWIMSAARAGHPGAQFLAATHWLSAETEAAKKTWLEKAAAQNHAGAKEKLVALTKDAATAETQAAEAAARAVTDRELAAKGDADAAHRLFRKRMKEVVNTIIADSIAAQKGVPTSGKNYRLGHLDSEMIRWMDVAVSGAQLESLAMLHDYFRDEQPETAYLLLLFRRHLAQTELQLALPKDGFGTNSQDGFLKAFALLGEKLSAEQRARAEALFKNQWSGPWLDNRLGTNFEFGLCGFPQDRDLAHAFYRRAAEAGFRAGQVNLARCYELGIGVPKDPALARTWSATADAQSSNHAPTTYRISESIKQKPSSVAAVKASLPVKVDELDLLRSKAGYLQGQTVLFAGKIYQVPEKIEITALNDEVLLTAIGAAYTYSTYHSRSIFGTRMLTGTTTKVKVRDLMRYIENVSGAYIVTEVGPCKDCAGQGSFWDARSRNRTGCNNCGSTGCVATAILNNGSSRAY